jgi:hypothetical protein
MTAVPAVHAPRLRFAVVLGVASFLAVLALFPYLMMFMPGRLARIPLSPVALAALQALQAAVLAGVLGGLGLWLGERYGLTAPWLRAWIYRQPPPAAKGQWLRASLLGLAAAVVVLAVDPQGTGHESTRHLLDLAWRGALASFYGGIVEEVLFRLFLVSLLVWLLARLGGGARPWMYVSAIVLAALLFGAGHLPGARDAGMTLNFLAISRILLLNAIVGVVCGWLFWKRGLEHAMLAHFSADLVLHVAAPLTLAALA